MRRAGTWAVGLVYALAWFVQVYKSGDTLADGTLPGWQALRVSLYPLTRHFEGGEFRGSNLQAILCVSSGLTNIAFVAGFVRLARRTQAPAKPWASLLFVSAAINTFWIIDMASPDDMRAGYWLWLASFVALGLVARFRRAGVTDRA